MTRPRLNPVDRLFQAMDEAMPATPGPQTRAQVLLCALWSILVGLNVGLLSYPEGASRWLRIGAPLVYGELAGVLMWGCFKWAETWAQRFAPFFTQGTLARGRMPGFGALSLFAVLGPVAAFFPLAYHLHLRTVAVYLPGAYGLLCLVQAYGLASKSALSLIVQARDEALRARLAPHFLFNTLNTLHAQIESDPRGAQATTERLASLFRQVLEAADRPTIPLRDELRFVEAYLGIEKARLGGRLQVRIEVPEEVEACEVPPLSLQVLAENAVKHGVAPQEQGGEIRIAARREGPFLVLEVADSGAGVGAHPGTGTALETLRGRLARPEDLRLDRVDGRTVAGFRWRQR
jgi:hypothetical protein